MRVTKVMIKKFFPFHRIKIKGVVPLFLYVVGIIARTEHWESELSPCLTLPFARGEIFRR